MGPRGQEEVEKTWVSAGWWVSIGIVVGAVSDRFVCAVRLHCRKGGQWGGQGEEDGVVRCIFEYKRELREECVTLYSIVVVRIETGGSSWIRER